MAEVKWVVNRDMACKPGAKETTTKMVLEVMASKEEAMEAKVASVEATKATHTSRTQVAMVVNLR